MQAYKNLFVRLKPQLYFTEKFTIRNRQNLEYIYIEEIYMHFFSNFKELYQFNLNMLFI